MTAVELGFRTTMPVAMGGRDQPCGALGAGVLRPGDAMYTIGTVECIAPALDGPVERLAVDGYPCYPHAVPDLYVPLAGKFTGGALLRWYRDTLGAEERRIAAETDEDVYDVIVRQVTDRPSGLFVLPHFAGTGAPFNDPAGRGGDCRAVVQHAAGGHR